MSYSSQYPRGKRKFNQRSIGWSRIIYTMTLLTLLSAVIFGIYEYKSHPEWSVQVAEYRERFTSWLALRKQHLNQKVAKVRRAVGDGEDAERVVNFEFYNTLQDVPPMQVAAQAAMKQKQDQKLEQEQKQEQRVAVKPAVASAKISRAADLEKDLLAAIKQKDGEK